MGAARGLDWRPQQRTSRLQGTRLDPELDQAGGHTVGWSPSRRPLWDALYSARAELVINDHDHDHERFGLQDRLAGPTRSTACASSWSAPAARHGSRSGRSQPTAGSE